MANQMLLSPSEIGHYNRDGLIVPQFQLPTELVTEMRSTLAPYLPVDESKGPDFVPDLMKSGFGLRYGRTPQILEAVGQLIGPDFVLWASGLFGKPARNGKPTPWHQDGAYWPIEPLATCTVWLALDPSHPANGCLRFLPGSHRNGAIREHRRYEANMFALNRGVVDDELCERSGRDVVLETGQISIHDVLLLHGSRPNKSGQRRAGVTFRFMPTTSLYDRARASKMHRELGVPDISERILSLVSGRDRHGGNDVTLVTN